MLDRNIFFHFVFFFALFSFHLLHIFFVFATFIVCLVFFLPLLLSPFFHSPFIIRLTRRESVVGVSQTAKNKLIKKHMKNYAVKRELNAKKR